MRDWLNEINNRFPVRNTKEQKNAFCRFSQQQAESIGYSCTAENNEGHVNLVIGDAQKAEVLFTAHYDTPRRALFPNLMLPAARLLHWLYAFTVVLPILAVSILGGRFVQAALRDTLSPIQSRFIFTSVYLILYLILFLLLFRGPANRHNKNDNTSGTAAVFAIAELLAGNSRVAYILFDDEEKGKKGSKAYAKTHPLIHEKTLIINMDCVGNGERFLAAVPDSLSENAQWGSFERALAEIDALIFSAGSAALNSDQKNFTYGVGICACRHSRVFGWYTSRIHTGRDTVASADNIAILSQTLAKGASGMNS